MRIIVCLMAIGSLAACTQPAAQVDNRGAEFFGKNPSSHLYANFTKVAKSYSASSKPYNSSPNYTNNRTDNTISSSNLNSDSKVTSTVSVSSVTSRDLDAPATSSGNTQTPARVAPKNIWKNSTESSSTSFIKPVEGKVASAYGKRNNGLGNDGISYAAPLGEPVYASANGEVAYVGDELKSYGNMVIIKHQNNYNTAYSHMDRTVVAKGSHVKQGQIIGYVGQTGDVSQPELHFALRKGTATVNPEQYLSNNLASTD